ncbi:hypothetical protein JMN32_24710 [Fulvivirga sp. 29W222]|uniref:DUF4369 domain-containing protein n=1 Tax=Fulvivirga marina TaxID=2494733 RepID=A0A937KEA9_9BACT|nr:hypothetical protein [Fulvivirga marina]MBL6449537.1 hypothetical protein [Fulvivirga marina]
MKKGIAAVLCLLSFWCYGQTDYVVTTHRDTIQGEVQILLPSERYEEVTIKTEDATRRFKAYQFLEVGKDSLIYRSVKFGEIYKIMQLEVEGYLSLLSFRSDGNYSFGSKYLLKKTGDGIEVPTLLFKKIMSDFLSDCNEVEKKIENKTYKRSDIDAVVTHYNNCIQVQTQDLYADTSSKKKVEPTVISEVSPAGAKLADIKKKLQTIRSAEAPELMVLLNDIESKLTNHRTVPPYMIAALREQGAKLSDINTDITELIELINQQD